MTTHDADWGHLLARFALATPDLLAVRELRRRSDTKFVMRPEHASAVLGQLVGNYAVLAAGDARVASYRTLYFDTADLEFFHAHRRGRRVRRKVRIRHYPERRLSVLEVKSRRSEHETSKVSRTHPFGECELSADERAFLRLHTGCTRELRRQVWTNFRRITLLGLRSEERVTLDLDLEVETGCGRRSLEAIAIVEVKQRPFCRDTVAMAALRANGRRPGSLSKYCTAVALTRPELRVNRLLPDLRAIEGACA